MNRELLTTLSTLDTDTFLQSENNVKYNIVIPFLHAFGHSNIDLEHAAQGSRIDINIGNKIIVETKALNQDINKHIQQLSDYVGRESPVIAILTNGRHFRIYSPHWRKGRNHFIKKVIYEFQLENLSDIELQDRLNSILSRDNFKNESFIDNVELREKEILDIEIKIDYYDKKQKEELLNLSHEINDLKEQENVIRDQIEAKVQIVKNLRSTKSPELIELEKSIFYPGIKNVEKRPISDPQSPRKPSDITSNLAGVRYKIENQRKGVTGYGHILENGKFLVHKGTIISDRTAPQFKTSSPSAHRKRDELVASGTITEDRKFSMDYEFNSKSAAASVILRDSADGNKQWVKVQ